MRPIRKQSPVMFRIGATFPEPVYFCFMLRFHELIVRQVAASWNGPKVLFYFDCARILSLARRRLLIASSIRASLEKLGATVRAPGCGFGSPVAGST